MAACIGHKSVIAALARGQQLLPDMAFSPPLFCCLTRLCLQCLTCQVLLSEDAKRNARQRGAGQEISPSRERSPWRVSRGRLCWRGCERTELVVDCRGCSDVVTAAWGRPSCPAACCAAPRPLQALLGGVGNVLEVLRAEGVPAPTVRGVAWACLRSVPGLGSALGHPLLGGGAPVPCGASRCGTAASFPCSASPCLCLSLPPAVPLPRCPRDAGTSMVSC